MPFHRKKHTLARQWELLRLLPSRGVGKTAAELTIELEEAGFEVSKRQVERDLAELRDAFDLDCNDRSVPYGWRWRPGASVELPGLTLAEALSLNLVEETVRPLLPLSLLDGLASRFSQARAKLQELASDHPTARWRDKVRTIAPALPLMAPQMDADMLSVVQECLLADEIIDAQYAGMDSPAPQSIRLHPLGLMHRAPVTYLVATAWNYPDVRLYALHRFQAATRTHEPSRRPRGFNLDAALAAGLQHFGDGRPVRLKARVSDGLARILTETPLSADQQIKGTVLTATVQDGWQLQWWLLSQGSAVEVMAPVALRKRVAAALREALGPYGQNAPQD